MDRLTSLEVLVAIVDSGGFARAAGRLNMSPAMVSTHVARLEDRLGTRLLHRSTRRFALTPEGHVFIDEARAILDAVSHAENAVRRGGTGPSGRVAIDAPSALGLRFIVPALPLFRESHPRIAIDLSVGDRSTLFQAEGFDLLVRVGSPPDGKGEVIPLGRTRFVQIASPAYIARRGAPATPDEIHEHDTILYTTAERPIGRWRFWKDGEKRSLRPIGVAAFNHGDAITAAALAGLGIGQTLEMLVLPELAAGTLVPVLTEWNRDDIDIQLFIPADRARRPAVKAAAEFLRDRIEWSATEN